jgi:hypothetical protein
VAGHARYADQCATCPSPVISELFLESFPAPFFHSLKLRVLAVRIYTEKSLNALRSHYEWVGRFGIFLRLRTH